MKAHLVFTLSGYDHDFHLVSAFHVLVGRMQLLGINNPELTDPQRHAINRIYERQFSAADIFLTNDAMLERAQRRRESVAAMNAALEKANRPTVPVSVLNEDLADCMLRWGEWISKASISMLEAQRNLINLTDIT